jgi:KipI family sensor histidine kinase inhibitor
MSKHLYTLPAYQIIANGDSAITIFFKATVSTELTIQLLSLNQEIKNIFGERFHDLVISYQSITLYFSPDLESFDILTKQLKKTLDKPISIASFNSRLIEIPVCYEEEYAPDLKTVAEHTGLTVQEIVKRHTQVDYLVNMLGFLPGFLYLGGLSTDLFCPRKKTPAMRIEPGSVGIGGNQTGIYPVNSPGGWQIIGRTPVVMFNPKKDYPAIANPLDKIRFVSIASKEFIALSQANRISQEQGLS